MVIWTRQATEDLKAIHNYIARDSQYYAKSVTTTLVKASESLDHYPFRGRKVPETADPHIRELQVYSYRMIYWIREESIYVLTLVHSRQNFPTITSDL